MHGRRVLNLRFRSEHEIHRPDCPLVALMQQREEEDYTVRDWLQLMAYAYSTQKVSRSVEALCHTLFPAFQYDDITDAVDNLSSLMTKLSKNTEKLL